MCDHEVAIYHLEDAVGRLQAQVEDQQRELELMRDSQRVLEQTVLNEQLRRRQLSARVDMEAYSR